MFLRLAVILLLAYVLPTHGNAQPFPSRPVLIVVPYAAGGAPDFVARILAERLSAAFGKPVYVENRPGANGSIGAASVARSAPDGYTLLLADNSLLTVSPFVQKHASFDAMQDLVPVAGLVDSTVLLLVDANLPVTSLGDFVAYARRSRPKPAYATLGIGSAFHLAFEEFERRAGIDLLHVPYKSLSQAAVAAANGDVAILMAGRSALPLLRAGKLRALAIATPRRSATYPSLHTLNETFPGVELSLWQGLFAPVGTPAAVLDRLEREVRQILDMPDIRQRLAGANDLRPLDVSRAQLADRIQSERKRNGVMAKQLGLSGEQ